VSPKSTREYIQAVQTRYRRVPKVEKGRLLDEACRVTGYHRKAVLRLLHRTPTARQTRRRGRPRQYGLPIHHTLERLWEASGRLCAKRLGPFLPELIAALERHGEVTLTPTIRAALCTVSPATIDRILQPVRHRLGRQPYTSGRALTAIQRQVPVRTFTEWAQVPPGSVQGDLVSHCGTWPDGFFLRTLVAVDVPTSWTEHDVIWGGTQHRVKTAIHHVRQRFPMGVRDFHADNGGEFLNHVCYAYCQQAGIHFTRGRPYRKNDQAYVEQKIGASVRALIGYGRYSTRAAYAQLQEFYRLLRLQMNFFHPVAKLIARHRIGAKIVKRYDQPHTPYQRVLAAGILAEDQRQALEQLYLSINPVQLQAQITTALEKLWRLADPHY
jgi:hypothetical protein